MQLQITVSENGRNYNGSVNLNFLYKGYAPIFVERKDFVNGKHVIQTMAYDYRLDEKNGPDWMVVWPPQAVSGGRSHIHRRSMIEREGRLHNDDYSAPLGVFPYANLIDDNASD